MVERAELQTKFEDILGSRNVYYQPPESLKMKYPCIRYERSIISNEHASNGVYRSIPSYTVTVIDEDPDSPFVTAIASLPTARHSRHYTANGLNHDVFTIY